MNLELETNVGLASVRFQPLSLLEKRLEALVLALAAATKQTLQSAFHERPGKDDAMGCAPR
ncbi:MAG: hypothetical protein ACOH1R_00085 [Luteimonas sp.]